MAVCILSASSVTPRFRLLIRSNGNGARRRSPTTAAGSFSSRTISRYRRAGARWRRKLRSRNIFTATSATGLIGKKAGAGNYFYNRQTERAERAATQYEYPQGSACFIQSVEDTMEDIMRLAMSEAMLFKYGSGTGSDLSSLRSTREKLSGGGKPSGPLSFLKVYDQVANVVKSGGKTRRAAKMNTLKDWHPDIEEFIDAKQKEEKKAWALIERGYDGSYNGDAYGSVMYQNENLSEP